MRIRSFFFAALSLAVSGQAFAAFHFMQIEQAMGGVAGDTTQQAVQLRMRSPGQSQMQFSKLIVRDATGANPVTLIDFTGAVANGALGDRVLIASPGFVAEQGPAPDFVMTSLIPLAYLAGGKLSFESDGDGVIYSLCWGSYSGSTLGTLDNDDDGVYGPCEPGPLPSTSLSALLFGGAAGAKGTTNEADFALTSGPAVFTNNARTSATVAPPLLDDGFEG